MAVGIICEYNPFHNGHLYHLNKVKELAKGEEIILILGGNFLQRGNLSIISKYNKTKIALEYGINLVIELPFQFATQNADLFAKGAISILKKLKCNKLVFGSESANIELFKKLAKIQLNNKEYNKRIKKYLKDGLNYPTALSKSLHDFSNFTIINPNDILALSYIKEIIIQNVDIVPLTIKRTNNYHDTQLNNEISSATSIRKAIKELKDIKDYVPDITLEYLNKKSWERNYFNLLKYKIITEKTNLNKYQTVDEGIENRILKGIYNSNNLEELISIVKTKRYTYNKINRMFTHILCSFTKEDAKNNKDLKYIRILGFDNIGKKYLNSIKKECDVPIITNIKKENVDLLSIEIKCDSIYNLIMNEKFELFKQKPIIKK